MKNPIILIPGIQGTKLFNVNEKDFTTEWSGIKKYYSNIHTLKLQKDGRSDQGVETIIERADVENLAYSEIINYLKSKGYRVYIFGYDWRKTNMDSGQALKEYVDKLRDKLNRGSFNFITHSMGALVLSAYFKLLGVEERNKVVSRAIFTVPPFLGSVEANFNLVIGKSKLFNSSDDFRKIARTFPAVYELLPVFDGAYSFESSETAKGFDLYDFSTYWQQVEHVDREDTKKKHRLISYRLSELGKVRDENDFIFDFSNCEKEFRKKLLVLAGGGSKTMDHIYVKKHHKHIKNFFTFKDSKDGDGTVPIESSLAFKKSILTLKVDEIKLETWANSFMISRDWHSFFLNNGRVQNVIKRFINNDTELSGNWYESLGGRVSVEE